jgi:hypothetical protein
LTRATTLPVLTRREGRRLVMAVHAPLPDPADDRGEGCSRAAPSSFPWSPSWFVARRRGASARELARHVDRSVDRHGTELGGDAALVDDAP